ncbi:MAG: DNA helicase RecQ [Bacteroidales bacterium]|nr:DNA helicase RecQ [Bacteroidales bacterium]
MQVTTEELYSKLKNFFGYDKFKGQQEEIIRHLIAGGDAFVLMPTGGGKSLCYQLPALCLPGTAIVISPLIALMKNQVDAIRGLSHLDQGVAHFLNSSLNKAQIKEVKDDLLSGITKILYVAPESLTKEENIQLLKSLDISFYAVDEAHCISEWGHDFRPEYRRIREIVQDIGLAPIIALTATATPKVQSDIQKNLKMTEAKVFKSSFNRPNLYYEIRDKSNTRRDIIKFIRENPGKSGIIYCLSRRRVEEIAELLNVNGIRAVAYHAGMDATTRSRNQDAFLMEEVDVIVATIAFGMGIDKPDIRFVIHYDIPKSLEGYYQETGRAGRDGKEGQCIAFYSHKDILKLEKFMQNRPLSDQEIGKQLLNETMSYAESNQCRRKILLNYFGEDYDEPNCGACDNCLHPWARFDGQKDLMTVIDLICSLKERFRIDHLASILAGVDSAIIKSYNHDESPYFGIGGDKPVKYWTGIIRQGVIFHYLEKDIERYGLISVTEKGRRFHQEPHPVKFTEDREFVEGEDDDDDEFTAAPGARHQGDSAGDPALLAMLKDVRKEQSRKLNLPPWIIFSDPSLEDMTLFYPVTIDELKKCQGVGEGKAARFGQPFVELIARYVEDNDIIRPDDIVVRSVPNKSAERVQIIQSIDRRLPLEDIAEARHMEFPELLDAIESIVSSGLKINLDYYIRQELDEYKVEDIYAYFREEAESDSVEDAMAALGPDYTEEEVRLVRIKFLSEIGN